MFDTLAQNDKNYSSYDLLRVAESLEQNIMIVTNIDVLVGHYNMTNDLYGTIVHSSYYNESIEHFYTADMKQIMHTDRYSVATKLLTLYNRKSNMISLDIDYKAISTTIVNKRSNLIIEYDFLVQLTQSG